MHVIKTSVYAGGGVIQTNQVTTTPFIIVYRAVDALGNVARPVVRSVSVYDPCSPERYCPDTGVNMPWVVLCTQVQGGAIAIRPLLMFLPSGIQAA